MLILKSDTTCNISTHTSTNTNNHTPSNTSPHLHSYLYQYFSDINTNADIITINSTIHNPAPVIIDMTMRKLLR